MSMFGIRVAKKDKRILKLQCWAWGYLWIVIVLTGITWYIHAQETQSSIICTKPPIPIGSGENSAFEQVDGDWKLKKEFHGNCTMWTTNHKDDDQNLVFDLEILGARVVKFTRYSREEIKKTNHESGWTSTRTVDKTELMAVMQFTQSTEDSFFDYDFAEFNDTKDHHFADEMETVAKEFIAKNKAANKKALEATLKQDGNVKQVTVDDFMLHHNPSWAEEIGFVVIGLIFVLIFLKAPLVETYEFNADEGVFRCTRKSMYCAESVTMEKPLEVVDEAVLHSSVDQTSVSYWLEVEFKDGTSFALGGWGRSSDEEGPSDTRHTINKWLADLDLNSHADDSDDSDNSDNDSDNDSNHSNGDSDSDEKLNALFN
eukprot:TRINITY_DN5077_c1_g1_i2.p1 TRINITY_DN5077_c1_g1~~TRINITY_DN5077_c1_g1_i2.p1  ORF type:complete len:372 (+),score=128.43 TRINITY_DN5077_c1_g1_i2:7-1122(+)